jgi:hypothetical protein
VSASWFMLRHRGADGLAPRCRHCDRQTRASGSLKALASDKLAGCAVRRTRNHCVGRTDGPAAGAVLEVVRSRGRYTKPVPPGTGIAYRRPARARCVPENNGLFAIGRGVRHSLPNSRDPAETWGRTRAACYRH